MLLHLFCVLYKRSTLFPWKKHKLPLRFFNEAVAPVHRFSLAPFFEAPPHCRARVGDLATWQARYRSEWECWSA